MPRAKKRTPGDEYEFLGIRINSYEASVDASLHTATHNTGIPWRSDDNDPLYCFTTRIELEGVFTYPSKRAGNLCRLFFYEGGAPSDEISATLTDAQARNEHGSVRYREYSGSSIPVYERPLGLATLEKVRGEPGWIAHFQVASKFIGSALSILNLQRERYVAIHERKRDRTRWVQSVTLQTNDPAV